MNNGKINSSGYVISYYFFQVLDMFPRPRASRQRQRDMEEEEKGKENELVG